jgi:hypothetical protein
MMKRSVIAGLAWCLVGYAAGANAVEPSAVLRQPQGRVFVGQAATMGPAREGMPLYAGNRVVAVAGGRVAVVYPDGCVATLPENSVLAVKGPDQCRLDQARVRATSGFRNTRIGQAGPLPAEGPGPAARANAAADPGNAFEARLYQPTKTSVDSQGNLVTATTNMGLGSGDVIDTETKGKAWVYFNGCEVRVGPGEDVSVDELKERCKAGVWDNPDSGRIDPVAIEASQAKTAGLKYPRGKVQVARGAATVAVAPNLAVFGQDRIRTGPDSEVIVVFGGCGVQVEEDRRVSLSELSTVCLAPYWTAGGVAVVAAIAAAVREDDEPASPQ